MSELEWLDEFADNLRFIMKEKGCSQSRLAKESGVPQSAISRYLRREQTPGIKAIINFSYVLDIELDDLINFYSMIE